MPVSILTLMHNRITPMVIGVKNSIINLDLNSDDHQQTKGKRICKKYDIEFLIADTTEFQENINFRHLS